MEYERWSPEYERVRAIFGFPMERERAARDRLRELLPEAAKRAPLERITRRLRDREAIVVGNAPGAGPPPVWRLEGPPTPRVVLAADGATAPCLSAGLVPDLVVTDLDGPVPSEVTANARGALVVVHAHGDNMPALERWVPEFGGELAGSWAGPPDPEIVNLGGFTDGDRAAYLAEHGGARRILLWGFDFEAPDDTDPPGRARKLQKLQVAHALLSRLAGAARCPILIWAKDGGLRPWSEDQTGPSTQ